MDALAGYASDSSDSEIEEANSAPPLVLPSIAAAHGSECESQSKQGAEPNQAKKDQKDKKNKKDKKDKRGRKGKHKMGKATQSNDEGLMNDPKPIQLPSVASFLQCIPVSRQPCLCLVSTPHLHAAAQLIRSPGCRPPSIHFRWPWYVQSKLLGRPENVVSGFDRSDYIEDLKQNFHAVESWVDCYFACAALLPPYYPPFVDLERSHRFVLVLCSAV